MPNGVLQVELEAATPDPRSGPAAQVGVPSLGVQGPGLQPRSSWKSVQRVYLLSLPNPPATATESTRNVPGSAKRSYRQSLPSAFFVILIAAGDTLRQL